MSAVYRIDVHRDLTAEGWPWEAKVIRLSDERIIAFKARDTQAEAEHAARQVIRGLLTGSDEAYSVTVDEHGEDAS